LAFALLGLASLTTDLGLAAAQQGRLEVAAESAALAAFHHESRFRYAAALGGPTSAEDCENSMTFEDCARILGERRGRETAERVLAQRPAQDPAAQVALGPAPPALRVERCGALDQSCWEVEAEQAMPLLFGQGSLIGFQGSSLRDMRGTTAEGSLLPPGGEPVAGALRKRGIPIGSASRAEAHRVVRVGPFREASGLPGRAPFAIDALAYANPANWPLDGGARAFLLNGAEGRTIADPEVGLRVGTRVASAPAPLPGGIPLQAYYVPMLRGDTVIGFALARLRSAGEAEVVLERLPPTVAAPGNASASLRSFEREQVERYRSAIETFGESGGAAVEAVLVQAAVLR